LDRIGAHAIYRRGEVLFDAGDAADTVFTVVSGCIRLVKLMSNGQRHIFAFVMPGQLAGATAAAAHAITAEAVSDCVVIREGREALDTRFGADPAFAAAMRATAADDLKNAYDRMVLVCRRPAAARVAWLLLTMRRHAARDTFALPMSRADIADYLGMALETASRAFTELKRRKVIAAPDASVVTLLDRALAERIAETE
jgi:CRP-like cAMP-binding protein